MKLFIASDIHGSALYCEKMLEAFEKEKADKLLLLGDILYHGPRNDLPVGYAPKKVIEMLNPMAGRILCVRGNCEAEVDQMVLDFPCMADYALIEVNGITIYATHGHLKNHENPPKMKNKYVLLNGHTHVPACRDLGEFYYVNPGSVSIPKEGSKRGYMTLENKILYWKSLDGEIWMTGEVRSCP